MLSFNELQTLFNALVPLSGKALVTGRLLGIADNFTRFEYITLNNEMLQKLVRNHSVGVRLWCDDHKAHGLHILCNELEVRVSASM